MIPPVLLRWGAVALVIGLLGLWGWAEHHRANAAVARADAAEQALETTLATLDRMKAQAAAADAALEREVQARQARERSLAQVRKELDRVRSEDRPVGPVLRELYRSLRARNPDGGPVGTADGAPDAAPVRP